MRRIKFFEVEQTPKRIHIGLRMIKTVVAVFFCALFGWLRGEPAFFSMIAAVACMQNTTDQTVETALNQVIGTVIGALFGLAAVYIELLAGLQRQQLMPVYYLIVSAMLIPVILTTLLIKKPSISAFVCVVFLSVAVMQIGAVHPWIYALQRTFDIFMGVVAAFVINLVLPNHIKKVKKEENSDHEV